MSEGDLSIRQHFLDPAYWQPRLQLLARIPRKLVVCPRPDLARPGIEVLELRLQAHDGAPLRALLGRSAFAKNGEAVRLRPQADLRVDGLDWDSLTHGATDVVLCLPPGRRLEDRVLDVLRVVEACCSLESVDCTQVRLGDEARQECEDEFVIAGMIRDQGWL